MSYNEKKINTDNLLNIWNSIVNEDKIYFYNPLNKHAIVAWNRTQDSMSLNDPYIFYTTTFFDSPLKSDIWKGFSTEEIHFRYWLLSDSDSTTLYYDENEPEPMFCEKKIDIVNHKYFFCNDEYRDWETLFYNIKDSIISGDVEKVVASRKVKIECEDKVNVASIIQKLMMQNKDSFVYAITLKDKTFLGATPEILVEKTQRKVKSYALAGTIARCGDDDGECEKFLLADYKNNYEHTIVAKYIYDILKKCANKVRMGDREIMSLKNLYHLKTEIVAEDIFLELSELVKLLHPTPAMGGKPRKAALELIRRVEQYERGLFAAPLGVIDKNGNGVFIIGIRSALVIEKKIYAFAGCGIVEQSDCREEYDEINHKLQTIVDAL